MHFSCLTSGTLLARLGRPEVSNCIGGLKQYSYAYEEAGEEAIEMERTYSSALAGDTDINHMSSVVIHQANSGSGSGPMVIDSNNFEQNGGPDSPHVVRAYFPLADRIHNLSFVKAMSDQSVSPVAQSPQFSHMMYRR